MKSVVRLWYVCLLALILGSACSINVSAQTFALTEEQQAYADALQTILKEWEAGKIEFTKNEETEKLFSARLDAFSLRQAGGEVESVIPMDFVAGNWKKLPESVKVQRPLSAGAYLLLIAGVVDASAELKKIGIEPTYESLLAALQFPLYLTLGAAEEEAKKNNRDTIDSISIRRGGVWFFSLGWPFCCAE